MGREERRGRGLIQFANHTLRGQIAQNGYHTYTRHFLVQYAHDIIMDHDELVSMTCKVAETTQRIVKTVVTAHVSHGYISFSLTLFAFTSSKYRIVTYFDCSYRRVTGWMGVCGRLRNTQLTYLRY